jgi:sec-independent protein translocase protein TatC
MSLGEHLVELKRRLFRSAIAVVVGAILGWVFSNWILTAMRAPVAVLAHQQDRLAALNFDSISSAFDLRIQIAITVGIVISSPVWLYQLWAYFVPALTRRELKYALGFFLSALPLFFAGCAAGWFVVPHIVGLLTSFAPAGTATLLQAGDYFDFILKLIVAVGVAFVLPVFLVLLNFVGVLSAHTIRRSWRVAVIVIVCFAAAVTPAADVFSMLLLAAPMAALYFLAAGVSTIHDRRTLHAAAQLDREYAL